MPSSWKQQCPGFATYRWHEDGAIEVQGEGFPKYAENSANEHVIANYWRKYGDLFVKHAQVLGLPVSWVVGIVAVESGGDEWACSPCKKPLCSFAPNCGGGVAKDGKHYVCCAYGLMQVTEANAKTYGMDNGAQLLGNPDDAIRIGCDIFAGHVRKHKGDPLVAVKQYNGCRTCKAGRVTVCDPNCMFGIGGQGNYAEKFARSVNTFLSLDTEVPHPKPPGYEEVVVSELRASVLPAVAFAIGGFLVGSLIWRR